MDDLEHPEVLAALARPVRAATMVYVEELAHLEQWAQWVRWVHLEILEQVARLVKKVRQVLREPRESWVNVARKVNQATAVFGATQEKTEQQEETAKTEQWVLQVHQACQDPTVHRDHRVRQDDLEARVYEDIKDRRAIAESAAVLVSMASLALLVRKETMESLVFPAHQDLLVLQEQVELTDNPEIVDLRVPQDRLELLA